VIHRFVRQIEGSLAVMMKPFNLEQVGSKLLAAKGTLADERWTDILQDGISEVWAFLTGPRGAGVHLAGSAIRTPAE
jgi:hypothetical protein